jgi:hypothetical protein
MTEGDERADAQLGICPVCKRGPVRITSEDEEGQQEGVCENHTTFLFLERDSGSELWRKAQSG